MKNLTQMLGLIFFCSFCHANMAQELVGQLIDGVYTAPEGVFTTRLPPLEGEMRDFPNAVSTYNSNTGAQNSLEYYAIPEEELKKYRQVGAEKYHHDFVRESFVNKRYQQTFQQVMITSESLVNIDNKEMYMTALNMNASSQAEEGKFEGQYLRILLATTVEDDRMVAYQIARTAPDLEGFETFLEYATKIIIIWSRNTQFQAASDTTP